MRAYVPPLPAGSVHASLPELPPDLGQILTHRRAPDGLLVPPARNLASGLSLPRQAVLVLVLVPVLVLGPRHSSSGPDENSDADGRGAYAGEDRLPWLLS